MFRILLDERRRREEKKKREMASNSFPKDGLALLAVLKVAAVSCN
jgi:hypothetical protein